MLVIQRPSVAALGEAVGNRQKFSVSPLEPGLGHTIGNSLRRMLLSSIPGAAITSVKFDEALHEFTTIEGVTEDVTEIILNLKDIVVRSEVDEVVSVRIDAQGPKDLTAGDISLPAGVDFVNGKQHIATLAAKANLSLEITIERGKGYLGSDRDAGRKTIGVIPVDALFSPVRRVSFEVERRASRSRPTTTTSCSTSRPTAPSRPPTRLPRPAPRCAACSISWRRSPTSRSPSSWANRRPRAAALPSSTCRSKTSCFRSVRTTA